MAIPLAKVLEAVRDELKIAQAQSDPKNPLIIEEIEVELQTVATCGVDANGEVSGKVEIKILDFFKLGEVEAKLAAQGSWERAATQKVKLKLSAMSLGDDGKMRKTTVNDEDDY